MSISLKKFSRINAKKYSNKLLQIMNNEKLKEKLELKIIIKKIEIKHQFNKANKN